MSALTLEQVALRNVRSFTIFRVFFSARFYYPVYALLFLDYGLTLAQFGLLNAVWAVTIVLLEVPSGALADTVGRRNLLIIAGVCMVLEMAVLLVAPIGGGMGLFILFLINRILSGAAEAAASGADEALAYDSLKAAGLEGRWGHVLERVQRDTSLAFFFAMMIGAAVYDPQMINALLLFLGLPAQVEAVQLIKLPILLSFFSGLIVLWMALRMQEPTVSARLGVRATLLQSWQQSIAAGKWIWGTSLAFGIILAAMILDSVVREFLTLASQYWKVIDFPVASFGLIGSGMALMGLFVPRLARLMTEKSTPLKNFIYTVSAVLVGLCGLGFAIPYWGIIPAIFLYASIQLTSFFVSRYLNEMAPSEQRATILSFRGLSTNFAYGIVSLLYSGLIVVIGSDIGTEANTTKSSLQDLIFVNSLKWFPLYFLITVFAVFAVHRLRFGRRK
ncbi:MAG: MFS family permease [Lentimonas sp.]|jgi:MFS family permease